MVSPAPPIQPADIAWLSLRAVAAGFCLSMAGCTATIEAGTGSQSQVALGTTGEAAKPPTADDLSPAETQALTEQQQRHLQVFTATLFSTSPDIDAETRRSAAQELLAMNLPESVATIDRALRSGMPAVMLASITAMQSSKPISALLDPAVAALPSAPAPVLEPLSWVIARHGEPAVRLVAPLAMDQSTALAYRLGPIRALGAFDSQSAAAALMEIVQREGEAAEAIIAACESLQHLTGLAHNGETQQWKAWWVRARELAPDDWSAFINQSLSKRAAQLQQDLQRQREASERIARELFNAYRDLYPTLPVEDQLRRLTALLQDPLPPLREFAISRIALLLRDSVRIPVDLQHTLADRLNDEVAALRIAAAKLLDEMNYESIGVVLTTRLESEATPSVVSAYLDVLSRRPCAAAIEPARRWLNDANLGNRAADAIWRALQSDKSAADQITALSDDVRNATAQLESAATIRLLAMIGADEDVAHLTNRLDGGDPAIRAAIAEGFFQRGLRQPLIQRAADPAIFPFAVRAIVEGPVDVAALRQLIGLTPEDSQRQVWIDGCVKVCDALSPQDLLAADDLLVATAWSDSSIRSALLQRATTLPPEQLSEEHRTELVKRQAAILMTQLEAAKAHALLESIGCNSPEVGELCFQAAALSGNYDKASQLHDKAGDWVALLVEVANRDLVQAAPLFTEIIRRFDGQLQQEEQASLDRVARLLRDAAASANATGVGFAFPR